MDLNPLGACGPMNSCSNAPMPSEVCPPGPLCVARTISSSTCTLVASQSATATQFPTASRWITAPTAGRLGAGSVRCASLAGSRASRVKARAFRLHQRAEQRGKWRCQHVYPGAHVRALVSAGTYIRSIASDL